MLQQSNNLKVSDVVHANALQVQGVAYSGGSAGSMPAVQLVLQEAQYSFFWKPAVPSGSVMRCAGVTGVYVRNLSVTSASLAVYQINQVIRNCSSKIGQARRKKQQN